MKMIRYVAGTVTSTMGHCVTFEAGKPTYVPDDPALIVECRAAGAIEVTPEVEANLANSAAAAAVDPEYQAYLAAKAAGALGVTASVGLPSQEDNLDDEDKVEAAVEAPAAETVAETVATKPAARRAGAKAA